MINFSSLLKSNIFKFTSVLGFNQALNFLLVFIYLKTIDSSVYGTIGLLQGYALLIGLLVMLGVRDGFYTLYYKVDKNTLYTNVFLFFLIVLGVVSFFSIYYKDIWIAFFSIPKEFYYLIFLYAMSNALYSILEITMRLESWNNLYLSLSLVRGVSVFILKLYFVLHINNNIDFISNVLYTDIFSYIIISIVLFIYINIKVLKFKYRIDFVLYKRLFKVSLPFLASNGSGWIFNGFDRILIERFFSLEILGIYMYGTRIAAALGGIIHQILHLLYGPKSLKLLSENRVIDMELLGEKIIKWLMPLIGMIVIASALLYIFLYILDVISYPLIVSIFLSTFLVEVSKIIPRVNGQKLLFLEKSHILSTLSIGSSLLLIFLYPLFIPIFGIGIIFLSQLLVYMLVTYITHQYILQKTEYKIVEVKSILWLLLLGLNLIFVIYIWWSLGV
jgi:O-antigen/teichoic acid export membrane protein